MKFKFMILLIALPLSVLADIEGKSLGFSMVIP